MPDTAPYLGTRELCDALEALLFAAKAPLNKAALRASLKRFVASHEGEPSVAAAAEPAEEPNGADAAAPAESAPQHDTALDASDAASRHDEAAASEASPAHENEASKALAAHENEATAATAEEPADPSEIEGAPFALSAPTPQTPSFAKRFDDAFAALQDRWAARQDSGFGLCAVAEGWAFRTHARFGALLRSEREGRPIKLSKAALETLAIVAYQQPVTKPEMDHLRGVDCGTGLRVLLERQLIEITGKKDEPGRPLLYATSPQFLDFFALHKLGDLPSLRQYQELHEDHLEASRAAGLTDLAALAADAPRLSPADAAAAEALAAAMEGLGQARAQAREAFAEHGIHVGDAESPHEAPAAADTLH